jgi:threonine dehydrogenase-like Zn-dependent dehydrogenase
VNEEQVRRQAENEALFRSLNEAIEGTEIENGADAGDPIDFVCECSSAECMKVVSVSREAYEAVREGGSTFIVAPGHEEPEIADVIMRHSGFSVVEKRGDAAAVAEETNPRD